MKYFLEINLSRLGLTFGQFKESNSSANAADFCFFFVLFQKKAHISGHVFQNIHAWADKMPMCWSAVFIMCSTHPRIKIGKMFLCHVG